MSLFEMPFTIREGQLVKLTLDPIQFEIIGRFEHVWDDFGDLMTVEEFKASCEDFALIDYDGFGYAARHDGGAMYVDRTVEMKPSKLDGIPSGTTHIVWFNR